LIEEERREQREEKKIKKTESQVKIKKPGSKNDAGK